MVLEGRREAAAAAAAAAAAEEVAKSRDDVSVSVTWDNPNARALREKKKKKLT
jgi:hypothetical protein